MADGSRTTPSSTYSLAAIRSVRGEILALLVAGLVLVIWWTVIASRVLETALLDLLEATTPDDDARLRPLIWAGACAALWLLPALTAARVGLGRSWGELGLGLGGLRAHLPAYVGLLGLMLGVVWLASLSSEFQRVYPLYRGPASGRLLWLVVYGLHFVGVELFFRGFLLFPFERRLGVLAPIVGALPYLMTHFGKPLPETLAALPAGLVLGWLALETRSIWGGVLVHVAIALAMEVLASTA